MVGLARTLFGCSLEGMTFANLGQHAIKLRTPALAAGGLVVLIEQTLAGNRHRLRNGRVECLGQPPGGFFGAGIGDCYHIEAYICLLHGRIKTVARQRRLLPSTPPSPYDGDTSPARDPRRGGE